MSAHARRDSGRPPGRHARHRRAPRRTRLRIGQSAVLVALIALGLSAIAIGLRSPDAPASSGVEQGGPVPDAESPGTAWPASEPVRLDVPAVGIHVDLVDLGLAPDGTLEVPSEPMKAGWYTGSPTPGQAGPSIIVGHVDSADNGPAVFFRLGELTKGARIDVSREDGRVARFEVTAVRSFPQSRFPTGMVYGNTRGATLRLITCGKWNDETEEYDNNVVVFAQLVAPAS